MEFFKTAMTTTAAVATMLIATVPLAHAMEDEKGWDASKSMTPALESTINVSYFDADMILAGKDGPSPSIQALVILMTKENPQVLMCRDYDLRKLPGGNFRPTHGALKASFGFGLPKNHSFENSRDALIKGSANISLYKLFDTLQLKNIKVAKFCYMEGGEDWGPAVTIPVYLTSDNSDYMEQTEAEKIVDQLTRDANAAFEDRQEDDIFTGRFRNFCLVPLKSLLSTGSDHPAVLDESKLEMIEINGQLTKLWDESQMRKNLLPHVDAFIFNSLEKK